MQIAIQFRHCMVFSLFSSSFSTCFPAMFTYDYRIMCCLTWFVNKKLREIWKWRDNNFNNCQRYFLLDAELYFKHAHVYYTADGMLAFSKSCWLLTLAHILSEIRVWYIIDTKRVKRYLKTHFRWGFFLLLFCFLNTVIILQSMFFWMKLTWDTFLKYFWNSIPLKILRGSMTPSTKMSTNVTLL